MKRYGYIGFIILSVIVSSCSNNHFVKFPETVSIVTRQQGFDSVYMHYPYRVRLFDTVLYVMDLHPNGYYCHEFTYPSMKFVRSFARRGKAPGELISIGNIAVNTEGKVYVLNDFGRRIYMYDRESDQMASPVELPEEMLYYPDFALYNDSVFIFPDHSGQSRVVFVDWHGNIIRQTGVIPGKEHAGNMPEAALGSAWKAFISYNPRNGVAALVTQYGEVLEIYDTRNDRTQVIIGEGGEPRCRFKGNNAIPNGILGYGDVFVGEMYIYALYWGHEYEKIVRGEITVEGGKYIHVFDLEGNPVRRYELDRHVTGIFVNEASGEVICTDVNEEQLVTFDLY